jgi:hemerythrin-like domain-containing protein
MFENAVPTREPNRCKRRFDYHCPGTSNRIRTEECDAMNDPIALLKRDHREAEAMLKELTASKKPSATRRKTTAKLVAALTKHMQIEEKLVYPLVDEHVSHEEEQEAETEHSLARESMAGIEELVDAPGFGAAVAMLTAGIKHHVKEEETEMFPKLKAKLDREELAQLGDAVARAKR